MKIWILSDLHLEVRQLHWKLRIPEADVCVLAGDIHRPLTRAVRWAHEHIGQHMPVVLVPGNHEFYQDSIDEGLVRGAAEAAGCPGVHLLHAQSVVLGGIRFVGAALWTDYAVIASGRSDSARDRLVHYAMEFATVFLNDHATITNLDGEFWTTEEARVAHRRERRFLEEVLAEPFDGPTVVVTHHAPHPGSIHARFATSALTPAFVSDLSEVIHAHQPQLWIHGHTHDSFDYVVGRTRVVCNPRGYGHENEGFNRSLIIEV